MVLDKKVTDAISESTQKQGQAKKAGEKLVSWLNALADANTSLENQSELETRLENVLDAIQIDKESED
ncbi:CxC ATPase DNA modification system associated small protein [Lusitaniella coriacea]|uniref:CxC ATPase DNA modification system associated small protein n=1 Tax=Lusitaniella coriacea TaxID=1983105 RepID=UPI003CEE875B